MLAFWGGHFNHFLHPKLNISCEARVFDQMTSDQASGSLKHDYYHLQEEQEDPFQMTRPSQHILLDRLNPT